MRSTREQRGWYFYDWANSAFTTTVVTVFLGPYLTAVAEKAAGGADGTLHPLGIPVAPDSLFPYLLSVAVLLQVLVLPVVGALADRTRRKRRAAGAASPTSGALATTALFFVAGGRYAARRGAVPRRQHLLRRRRSSSTTRCCRSSPARTSGTRCPAAAGPWATSAAACCWRSTWCCSSTPTGSGCPRATRCGSASCRRRPGGPAFTVIPLRRLRDRPAPAGAAGAAGGRQLPAAGADPAGAARATR